MRNLNSKLVMNFISEQGNDPIEKTYVAYTPLENYMCIAVAESYDNEIEENSAQIAVEAVLTAFEKHPSLKRLRDYIRRANEQVILHSTKSQLKVSLTVLVSDYTRMRYAVCGNTKLYVLYENLFMHISKTQTRYQQLLDIDTDAQKEPDISEIHNLTGYLGRDNRIRPFVSKLIELHESSTILFATSNLWGRLSEIEILDAYEYTKTGTELLDILQELLLSYQEENDQRIGSFTAAVLSIEKTYKEDVQKKKKRKRLIFVIVAIICAILMIFVAALFLMRAIDRRQMKEIEYRSQKGVRYMDYENYEKALEEYEQALTLTDKLNLNNWQYIEQKQELVDMVSGREAMLVLLQEAQAAYAGREYEQARKLYTQLQKEAAYQGVDALAMDAKEILEKILIHLQISQYVSLGDMYQSTEDYEDALEQYGEALKYLNRVMDLETQGDVQAKIFGIKQKQKEQRQAEEAAKQEEEKQKQEEKDAQKQAAADRAVVKINTLIASANNALDEGRTARAKELYRQALSRYHKFSGSSEDADKIYQEVTALGQAITEAEAKAAETAIEEQLTQASKYILQGKEAAKNGEKQKAKEFYDAALAVYQKLDIWDERTQAVYDAIDELETADAGEVVGKTPQPDAGEMPAGMSWPDAKEAETGMSWPDAKEAAVGMVINYGV